MYGSRKGRQAQEALPCGRLLRRVAGMHGVTHGTAQKGAGRWWEGGWQAGSAGGQVKAGGRRLAGSRRVCSQALHAHHPGHPLSPISLLLLLPAPGSVTSSSHV